MRVNSPSALFSSVALHAVAVALIVLTTVYFTPHEPVQPVIFELVAGPATAPDALQAPALGNTLEPVKLDVPKVSAAPEPAVEETPPPPAEVAPPKPKAKPDNSLAKEVKRSVTTSYRDYMRKHPTPKPAPVEARPAANVPRIDTQGIAGGVRGGSTANTRGGGGGNALTREEHNLLDTYISELIQTLKQAYVAPPGVSDLLEARVTFDITANGSILNPRISKSSGDRDFDQAVLEAFRQYRSIGPTPNRQSDTWTVTFRMRDQD